MSDKRIKQAEVICQPKFDNGDTSRMGCTTSMLAGMLVKDVGESQKEKFKQELSRILMTKTHVKYVQVDYDPDSTLAEALHKSEISFSNAPWKTRMWLDEDGSVKVRYGYGAEIQTLITTA